MFMSFASILNVYRLGSDIICCLSCCSVLGIYLICWMLFLQSACCHPSLGPRLPLFRGESLPGFHRLEERAWNEASCHLHLPHVIQLQRYGCRATFNNKFYKTSHYNTLPRQHNKNAGHTYYWPISRVHVCSQAPGNEARVHDDVTAHCRYTHNPA